MGQVATSCSSSRRTRTARRGAATPVQVEALVGDEGRSAKAALRRTSREEVGLVELRDAVWCRSFRNPSRSLPTRRRPPRRTATAIEMRRYRYLHQAPGARRRGESRDRAGGRAGVAHLPVQKFPSIESSSVIITTVYTGAGAETMRGFLTTPIERAVSSIDGIDYVESTSRAGVSTVTVRLKLDHGSTAALAEVTARLQQVRSSCRARPSRRSSKCSVPIGRTRRSISDSPRRSATSQR